MQQATDAQHFCVRCGSALEDGRCPLHGTSVSARGTSATASIPPSIHNNLWRSPPFDPTFAPPPAAPSHPPWPARSPGERDRPSRSSRGRRPGVWTVVAVALAAVLLVALVADHLYLQDKVDASARNLDQRLAAQLAATNALAARVGQLENKGPDASAVARLVQASVFTIDTPDGLGSGWVVASTGGTSLIVTDYHVVQSVWTGTTAHTVQVKQEGKSLTGTITKVDQGDDLAVVTVKQTLTPLSRATTAAMVGDAVLVVGSPLGLGGTVANGIVSSFRNGLIQFSAPISPGDSGGPVVNGQGQVIGVAESKLVGSGVEGLSFAIPITTVCSTVTTC
jgi:S1-C subfamily serine protease